ncbi:2-keto-3-deoxy-phosphogluconate aldolase [Halobacillus dabanensis]|uniref:2-keto-3-deoxy-phosphogluconate aldolase n=1 Tax=Halobacillus dabanensis TaxID=240302 RepID=A0A1I3UJY5_HALDA|nr:bifunctional 4-hydroxy-2-oxoglutarate aldolase/2-dehydro-3-deoxy-phosphogluconate aldolase [Halobacillus dabanensis]SFJ82057.1 2-keto-3-deoxy-phosphogluconate aldolase [Halobacillus dabanensis]
MINKITLFHQVVESGVVAVIRKVPEHAVEQVCESLIKGGVNALEVTVDDPNGLAAIRKLTTAFKGKAIIGAGTVLDSETAKQAIDSGAEFIVSPVLNEDVVKTTLRYGKLSVPGVMTPTEAITAYEMGVDMVKVFPASSVGASFIKNMKGPLPQIPIMTTGGVDLDNAADFIRAGAVAIGAGGNLVNHTLIAEGNFAELEQMATSYTEAVREARS